MAKQNTDFERMKRKDSYLYRGANGAVSRVIMDNVGVGPLQRIAAAIRDNPDLIPPQHHKLIGDALVKRLGPFVKSDSDPATATTMQGWVPDQDLGAKLDRIIGNRALAVNHMTMTEHVLWEVQLQSPSTARLLESTSKRPQASILYAYGMDVDLFAREGKFAYLTSNPMVPGKPNAAAFVAVMDRQMDDELAKPYTINFAHHTFSSDDAKYRIDRDQEVLVRDIYDVMQVVDLPVGDPEDAEKTANEAAQVLIAAGVVDV